MDAWSGVCETPFVVISYNNATGYLQRYRRAYRVASYFRLRW